MKSLDEVFAICLLAGFGLSVLLVVSGGRLGQALKLFGRSFRLLRWLFLPFAWLGRTLFRRVVHSTGHVSQGQRWQLRGAMRQASGTARNTSIEAPAAGRAGIGMGWMMSLILVLFGICGLWLRTRLHLALQTAFGAAAIIALLLALLLSRTLGRYLSDSARPVEREPLLLATGHVSVSIPAGGVGSIAYVAQGRRVTMPARGKDHIALSRGTPVVVVDLAGKVAVVEEL